MKPRRRLSAHPVIPAPMTRFSAPRPAAAQDLYAFGIIYAFGVYFTNLDIFSMSFVFRSRPSKTTCRTWKSYLTCDKAKMDGLEARAACPRLTRSGSITEDAKVGQRPETSQTRPRTKSTWVKKKWNQRYEEEILSCLDTISHQGFGSLIAVP